MSPIARLSKRVVQEKCPRRLTIDVTDGARASPIAHSNHEEKTGEP
jgi:hypothetical protein